jgi:hypothetical protein
MIVVIFLQPVSFGQRISSAGPGLYKLSPREAAARPERNKSMDLSARLEIE